MKRKHEYEKWKREIEFIRRFANAQFTEQSWEKELGAILKLRPPVTLPPLSTMGNLEVVLDHEPTALSHYPEPFELGTFQRVKDAQAKLRRWLRAIATTGKVPSNPYVRSQLRRARVVPTFGSYPQLEWSSPHFVAQLYYVLQEFLEWVGPQRIRLCKCQCGGFVFNLSWQGRSQEFIEKRHANRYAQREWRRKKTEPKGVISNLKLLRK